MTSTGLGFGPGVIWAGDKQLRLFGCWVQKGFGLGNIGPREFRFGLGDMFGLLGLLGLGRAD